MSGDQILIRYGVDLKAFREEIVPASEPVVLAPSAERTQMIRAILARAFTRG